jgi:hypothetical protein
VWAKEPQAATVIAAWSSSIALAVSSKPGMADDIEGERTPTLLTGTPAGAVPRQFVLAASMSPISFSAGRTNRKA